MSGIIGVEKLMSNVTVDNFGGQLSGQLEKVAKAKDVEGSEIVKELSEKLTLPHVEKTTNGYQNPDGIKTGSIGTSSAPSFGDILSGYVDGVNKSIKENEAELRKVLTGESDNIHRAMLAQKDSEMHLKLGIEIRNKLVEGYNELMKMSV